MKVNPMEFISDYIKFTKNDDDAPYHFSEEFQRIVKNLSNKISFILNDDVPITMSWGTYMKVSENHKLFKKMVGNWKGEATVWLTPTSKPNSNKIEMTNMLSLDKRFLKSSFYGDFLGTTFKALAFTGYDNFEEVYKKYAADNMSTGIINYTGNWDDNKKELIFNGISIEPESAQIVKVKEVINFSDSNSLIIKSYVTDSKGNLFKTMEIHFDRKH